MTGRPRLKVVIAPKGAPFVPTRFLECRDWGHAWRAYTARKKERREGGGFESVLQCARCETFRLRDLTDTGHTVRSRYRYAAGYLAAGGRITPAGRDAIRLATTLSAVGA
jgi:hypothetical protein